MTIHFGATVADKEGLLMDMEQMKREYNRYEMWNPAYRTLAEYKQTLKTDQINTITSSLLEKTKRERGSRFDF